MIKHAIRQLPISILARFSTSLLRGNIARLLRFLPPSFLFLGSHAQLYGLRNIEMGRTVRFGEYCLVECFSKNGIKLGDHFSLHRFSVLKNSFNGAVCGSLEIGDNVGIGEYSYICAVGPVSIGRDTIVGQYFSIHPQNHNYSDLKAPIRLQGTTEVGVQIGEDCWIGAKVTVLDGARVGSGCVVAAGSVVRGSFPDKSIIAGVPARIVGSR